MSECRCRLYINVWEVYSFVLAYWEKFIVTFVARARWLIRDFVAGYLMHTVESNEPVLCLEPVA